MDRYTYWEVLALHKAIMAVKFSHDTAGEFKGSPHLAGAAQKVFSDLVKAEAERSGYSVAQRWLEWQKVDDNRIEWDFLLEMLAADKSFAALESERFAEEVKYILSPLTVSDEQVQCLWEFASAR